MKWTELTPEQQSKLVDHFVHEFNLSEDEALSECIRQGDDLSDHWFACEHGVMY